MQSISNPTKSIIIMTFLSCFLILTRVFYTNQTIWVFLIWNLFLAGLPLLFMLVARKVNYLKFKNSKIKNSITAFLFLLWILFLPNAPYIITDLGHLNDYPHIIVWFDTTIFFVAALTGLSMGFYSMIIFQGLVKKLYGNLTSWAILLFVCFLNGFGVYLGRYGRLNSWELFSNPIDLITNIFTVLTSQFALRFTFGFSFMLIGLYVAYYFMQTKKYEFIKNV